MSGYLKFHRSLLEHPYWCRGEFSKGQAMWDLVGHARWKDGFVDIAGRRIDLKRGQLCWSIKQLAIRWGWSYNKVRRFLNELKADTFLDYQNHTVTTVISITNFDQYQGDESPDERPNESPDESQKKKGKKERSKYSALFETFWKAYPPRKGIKSGKDKAWQSWRTHNCENHASQIMDALRHLVGTDQWQDQGGRFIPMASTFINQKRWQIEIVPRGTSSTDFLKNQLDYPRQQILERLIKDASPDLMKHFKAYCDGSKPIPANLKSLIEEEVKG